MAKRKKISAAKQKKVNYLISVKARQRHLVKRLSTLENTGGYTPEEKRTKRNQLLNTGVALNTELIKITHKLGKELKSKYRDKSNELAEENDSDILGNFWDKTEIENEIFKRRGKKINGLTIGKQDSQILDILAEIYMEMGNYDYIRVTEIDENGNMQIDFTDETGENE